MIVLTVITSSELQLQADTLPTCSSANFIDDSFAWSVFSWSPCKSSGVTWRPPVFVLVVNSYLLNVT